MKGAGATPLANWQKPRFPDFTALEARYMRLEPLSPEAHAAALFKANSASDAIWDYLPYGPFTSQAAYHRWTRDVTASPDPRFHAIFNRDSGAWEGVASLMRIKPEFGVIEIGHVNLSPALQGTRAASEMFYLMMKWAFDAGYRRYEWKCDAANLPSRRAAQRLGMSFEGVFRQHLIVKGRNRDTAWFSVIDREWPALDEAFRAWLAPSNFDASGRQVERLSDLTRLAGFAPDPALRG